MIICDLCGDDDIYATEIHYDIHLCKKDFADQAESGNLVGNEFEFWDE